MTTHMVTQTIFDAYTKINPYNKKRLINFICQQHKRGFAAAPECQMTIEYAIKERPSFGRFVLIAEVETEIVAALVVNRTGMEGCGAKNNLVHFEIKQGFRKIGRNLLDKAVKLANGDISIHLETNHPNMDFFEKMGFQPVNIVMRFNANQAQKSIA